jgi:hypothetical protein
LAQEIFVTNTGHNVSKSPPTQPVSINDNLPTSNPPGWLVLAVLGCIGVGVLVVVFHASLGF